MKRRPTRSTRTREFAELERIRRRLTIALAALVIVTGIGIIGFSIIGGRGHSLVDAIYMTVITLTTVGFGEIIDMSHNPAARLFTVGLLLVGMGIVAYAVPMLSAFVIEGQMLHIFTRRRMETLIGRLTGHVLVCGNTPAAEHLAEELVRTDRRLVVVTPPGTASPAFERLGNIPRIEGDPSDDATLLEAGIDRAAGIVACMDHDKDNILVALAARRLAPRARIVAATESRDTEAKLRTVGADAVVNPSRIGGLRMASELVRPHVVSFLDRMLRDERSSLRVEEITVPADSPAAGRPLRWLGIDDMDGAMLVALRRDPSGEYEFKPSPQTTVAAGMTLIVMADADGRQRVVRRLATNRRSHGV